MLIIGGIKKLLHEDGLTKRHSKFIKDKGLNYVSNLSKPLKTDEIINEETIPSKAKATSNPEIKLTKPKRSPLLKEV